MSQTRTTEQSRYGAGTPGAAAAPLVPVGAASRGLAVRVGGAIGRWMRTAALVLGVAYAFGWVGLVLAVPALSRMTWRPPPIGNTLTRRHAAEAMRPYVLPRDPSITPEAAGVAFASMSPRLVTSVSTSFPLRAVDRPDAPWRRFDLSPLAFRSGVSRSYHGPDTKTILAAAAKGLPREELALLKQYGTAGVWAAFDRVARAPKVDFLAGRFVLPFGPDASAYLLPVPSFANSKELAYASVARAAWHLAEGRRDSAEAALRAVVSFGFQFVDHGTSMLDELTGATIVSIGRDGLKSLYDATRDPRAAALAAVQQGALAASRSPATVPWSGAASLGDAQARMIAFASQPGDATVPERLAMLYQVPRFACTSTRDLVMGPSAEVRAAFAAVRRDYAGMPGQLAEIDLIEAQLSSTHAPIEGVMPAPALRVANLLSRVYFNPRLGACTVMAPFGQVSW
ncbi:MAG TPA: hypothetical protein VG916_11330 [Gemmatimonadaceae bacterium]|nr:hypothetical protein [Gemmatimonadaceae bacterium]